MVLERNSLNIQMEQVQKLKKRMDKVMTAQFQKTQAAHVIEKHKQEKELSLAMDPKPMKRKHKKMTYARGNMKDKNDDGREDTIIPESATEIDIASSVESRISHHRGRNDRRSGTAVPTKTRKSKGVGLVNKFFLKQENHAHTLFKR